MKKITIIFLIFGLVFFTFGIKRNNKNPTVRLPSVVSTFCFIDDFVRYIGKGHIEAQLLIPADLDPHSYEPGKGDADQIMDADAVLYHGLNLEKNANLLCMIHDHSNSVALGKKIYDSSPEQFLISKNEVDPHFWLDVFLWSKIIDPIVETLANLDEEHRSVFEKRGQELKDKLSSLDRKVKHTINNIPKHRRYLVTTHNAFQYFVQRYICSSEELAVSRSISPEGFCPEVQVNLFDLSRVRDFIEQHQVRTLFREYSIPPNSLSRIQEFKCSSGPIVLSSDVLYSDSFISEKKDNMCYISMMEHNVGVISNELGKDDASCD